MIYCDRYSVYLWSILLFLLFSCGKEKSTLARIDISSHEPITRNKKRPCTVTYTYGEDEQWISAKVKYRGGLSARYKKKSYSMELEDKLPLAGLPKDDDWVLNSSYIDKTFMRHRLSYDLYRQMGEHNIAAFSTYVMVSENSEDQGLYILTEEINGKRVGLNKKDTLSVLWKDPPLFFSTPIKPQEEDNYYQQKYPKKQTLDKTWYIEKFRDFLFDSTDETFNERIGDWVDLDNIMDWHLLLLLSNNGDGIMKNFYLYKKDKKTPLRIAIWDYDHSFGRDGDNEMNMMERPLRWKRSILLNRLMNSSTYKGKLANRWKSLRKEIFTIKNIHRLMHIYQSEVKHDIAANAKLWPMKAYYYFDDHDYEQEVEIMKEFLPMRLDQLDKEFLKN